MNSTKEGVRREMPINSKLRRDIDAVGSEEVNTEEKLTDLMWSQKN